MSTIDPTYGAHPEDLLAAYALDILDEEETLQVESHLGLCYQCHEAVDGMRTTAAVLGQSVGGAQPPHSLQARVMNALPHVEEPSRQPVLTGPTRGERSWLSRTLVPVAAVLVIGLLGYNLTNNFLLSAKLDSLQRESEKLTQLEQMAGEDAQFKASLHELRVASYWLADSNSPPMMLEPPVPTDNSQGILLVAKDGRRAMLMVAGMKELPPPSSYQVWLMRQGQRTWVGQLKVDPSGWGTVTLHPSETFFGFEKMQLTTDAAASTTGREDMVLEGLITAQSFAK